MRASAYVGRVGITAVALGIGLGIGLAGGGAGPAWAAPPETADSPSDSASASDSAGGQRSANRRTARGAGARVARPTPPTQSAPSALPTQSGHRTRNRSSAPSARVPAGTTETQGEAAQSAPSTAAAGPARIADIPALTRRAPALVDPRPAAGVAGLPALPLAAAVASAPAPAMSFGFARPAAVSGLVSSITTALFGSNPQSPLGWAMLAGARGSIGGNRRGGALAAGSATAARAPAAGGPATPPPFASNEVLVGFKPGATSAGRAQAMANVNAKVIGRLGTKQMLKTDQGVVYRLSVPGGTAAAIQALSRNPAVA